MRPERGFTMVEFMVAMTVGMIMVGAVASLFLTSRQGYGAREATARVQENARFGLQAMERDLRMAGFRGCQGDNLGGFNSGGVFAQTINTTPNPALYADNFAVELQGNAGTGGGFAPALDGALAALAPSPDPGSDLVTVRGATGPGVPVVSTMASGKSKVTVASGAAFSRYQRVMVASCARSTVFVLSNVTGADDLLHTNADNLTDDLGWAYGPDASVMPVDTITYYVGASSNGTAIAGGLSLYRVRGANAPEELVEGVQRMTVAYGESVTGLLPDGNVSAERYLPANLVASWPNVVSIRVSVLFRSDSADAAPTSQTYQFDGAATSAGDRRVRRAFTTTIGLRNRTK